MYIFFHDGTARCFFFHDGKGRYFFLFDGTGRYIFVFTTGRDGTYAWHRRAQCKNTLLSAPGHQFYELYVVSYHYSIISLQYTINTYVHYQLVPGINYTQYIAYPPLLCHLLKPYVDTLHPAAEQFSNLCGTQMKTNRHAD